MCWITRARWTVTYLILVGDTCSMFSSVPYVVETEFLESYFIYEILDTYRHTDTQTHTVENLSTGST